MPIKPENKVLYPKDWPEIRERIRARAGNKCESCKVKNHSRGARDINGIWHDEIWIENLKSDIGFSLFGEFPKIIKIVCTVAHRDHDPTNNVEENLRFWCQLCHNRYDRKHRDQTIKERKLKGQLKLFK